VADSQAGGDHTRAPRVSGATTTGGSDVSGRALACGAVSGRYVSAAAAGTSQVHAAPSHSTHPPVVPEQPRHSVGDAFRGQLQSSLGAAYTLERELGGGGMSRVFVMDEVRLRRKLVVKVLSPELAAGVSAERFQREIELAASLQQANIVPLLAVGDTEGLPFYTMPFVDGLSLRARLERNGALPVGEAISVIRDVARALAYAHEHGVVHRDIKPENILLSGAAAVVTDFGIAKALAASKTKAPGGTLTQVGTSIGTPAYMAPEQAAGDPATDHRADLYALGCVAYEMLTGAAPFAGRPAHQLFAAHLNETPASLEIARPDAPSALAALVMRCLAKDPGARPQSARAILETLDAVGSGTMAGTSAGSAVRPPDRRRGLALRSAAALAVVAAAALGTWRYHARGAAAALTAPTGPSSIAVLPFENQGDSTDAYFADGITDAVRGKLTALSGSGLAVIARASSVSYRGTTKLPAAIAGELGVRYLLTGTVRFVGSGDARRVQVSPELVEVSPGHAPESRWAQPFDAAVKDVFAVQADIAGRVATAMQVALGTTAQARLAQAPTRDPAAYDAFLRGEAMRNAAQSDPRSLRRQIDAYGEAIQHDSTMAPAWAALAGASSLLYANSTPTPALARTALTAAERAIALDSTRSEGYVALAAYHRLVSRDLGQALAAASRGRVVAPQDADVRAVAAVVEDDLGQLEAARRDLAEAVRLDPRNARIWGFQSDLFLRLGRPAEARAAAARLLALAPTSLNTVLRRVLPEAAAGDVAAARQILARASQDVPREGLVAYVANYWDLGWLLDAEQERVLLTLGAEVFDGDRAIFAIVRAQQYGWRGDSALARAWGDSAAREFAVQLRAVPADPQRHVLRGLALAYAGHGREALAEAERGLALQAPTAADRESNNYSYFTYVAARTALRAGDRERALAWLAEARRAHYASPAWIRAEPTWAPLRDDPRFLALTAAHPVAD
jgi:eukaryotic-like serine/threonine-protein kinase